VEKRELSNNNRHISGSEDVWARKRGKEGIWKRERGGRGSYGTMHDIGLKGKSPWVGGK